MKFSIIIPVYNVEKYIEKCLKSVYEQTYGDYEVIIVNDGSTDNSQKIIDEYTNMDDRFRSYIKPNGGLSDARNFGLKYVNGDYIIFIDSDDYINNDLLLKLSECAEGNDVIRYNINKVNEEGKLIEQCKGLNNSGSVTFEKLILGIDLFETAWSYAYRATFWEENGFKFPEERIHEDFGLIPLVVVLAKKIYYLNYDGYFYVERKGSITKGSEKNKKRAEDNLYHFDFLMKEIEGKDIKPRDKMLLQSFLANGVISISAILEERDFDKYVEELEKRKVYDFLLADSVVRKLKKVAVRLNLKKYIEKRYRTK